MYIGRISLIMGMVQSRPTARFLSVNDKDMKEMIDHTLEKQKLQAKPVEILQSTFDDVVALKVIGCILNFLGEKETLNERLLNRKIDRALTTYAINGMKDKITSLVIHVKRIVNDEIPFWDRKIEVPTSMQQCEEILNNFQNENHVFYQHPLITAPILIFFAHLYLPILRAGVYLIPTYEDHAKREKERLLKVIVEYKVNTINARLEMITITSIYLLGTYIVDIFDSNEWKFWKFTDNYDEAVKNVYEQFFNQFIDWIDNSRILKPDFLSRFFNKKLNKLLKSTL